MGKKKVDTGSVIAIPVKRDGYKFAHVVYASSYFKDVIFLAFFPGVYSEPKIPKSVPEQYEDNALYTGSGIIRKGHWLLLGELDIPEHAPEAKRIVGGEVWIGDNHLGPATDKELKSLPKMITVGYRIIEERFAENSI